MPATRTVRAPTLTAALLCLVLGLPAQAQSNQAADDAQCSAEAVQQTGFDPTRPPPPPAQSSPQVAGSGSRAKGAAAGAIIGGASGGDAGDAAVAGAVAGGVAQRSRNRRDTRSTNAAVSQQQQTGMAAFTAAKTACMTARGYKVQ